MNQEQTINNTTSSKKRKKIVLFSFLGAVIIIILLMIFLFKTPITVTFNTNTGSKIDVATVNEEGFINVPAEPKRYGWDFEGWYLNSALTTKIDDLATYKFTSSTTIYAKWTLHRYTVEYHLDGGTNHPDNPSVYVIKHDKPEDITWEGDFLPGSKIPLPDQELMLSHINLKSPTKSGATFDGWYDAEGNKVTTINRSEPTDLVLYARWN